MTLTFDLDRPKVKVMSIWVIEYTLLDCNLVPSMKFVDEITFLDMNNYRWRERSTTNTMSLLNSHSFIFLFILILLYYAFHTLRSQSKRSKIHVGIHIKQVTKNLYWSTSIKYEMSWYQGHQEKIKSRDDTERTKILKNSVIGT